MSESRKRNRTPRWWRAYRTEILFVLGGLIAVNGIFISNAFRQTRTVTPAAAGQLGSFVGGYVGALFTLLSVLLLIRTLKEQRRASERQNFENKYFELLKMHRDNVAEVELQGASGRRLFVYLVRELRCALTLVQDIAAVLAPNIGQRELMVIAYYCLFYGVGPNSSRMLKMSLDMFEPAFVDAIDETLSSRETKDRVRSERKFGYTPFEGHQSRLGHYYRHLYQLISFVDQCPIPIDKYEHVKTIRAQLSTHEQALLLVNSLTPMGRDWWRREFVTNYKLVQNMPREFFDSSAELDVTTLFESGYFEWEGA